MDVYKIPARPKNQVVMIEGVVSWKNEVEAYIPRLGDVAEEAQGDDEEE